MVAARTELATQASSSHKLRSIPNRPKASVASANRASAIRAATVQAFVGGFIGGGCRIERRGVFVAPCKYTTPVMFIIREGPWQSLTSGKGASQELTPGVRPADEGVCVLYCA